MADQDQGRPLIKPFVSVILVNYNGLRFLDACLGSLGRLAYPRDRFEVVLVDNASADESVAWTQQQYPWVKVIVNAENLGFAGGNNVGIRATRGDYVALVNNDTAVEPGWLDALVEAAERDPKVGACTAKLLFLEDRLALRIVVSSSFESRKHGTVERRTPDLKLLEASLSSGRPIEYVKGVYGPEKAGAATFRRLADEALLRIPIAGPAYAAQLPAAQLPAAQLPAAQLPAAQLRLCLGAAPVPGEQVDVEVWCHDRLLSRMCVKEEPIELIVPLSTELASYATPVIQNAGSLVSIDGSGRDRGAVVEAPFHYYEADQGQYDQAEEVFAACGAALLYRRAMLDDVGLFDERFFMYYEDTDLSWRARLRGWKIVYVPQSIVRHVHCGSSGEWSPFFTFHVKKNRVAMVLKNGSWKQVLLAWAGYVYATAWTTGAWLRAWVRERARSAEIAGRLKVECKAGLWLLAHLASFLRERAVIQRRRQVSQAEIESRMQPISRM